MLTTKMQTLKSALRNKYDVGVSEHSYKKDLYIIKDRVAHTAFEASEQEAFDYLAELNAVKHIESPKYDTGATSSKKDL